MYMKGTVKNDSGSKHVQRRRRWTCIEPALGDKGDHVMSHYPALSRDPISSHACVTNSYRTNHQRVIRSRLCGDGCHVFLSEAVYG